MLSPTEAAQMLHALDATARDDPTESSLPLRWWIDDRGHLHRSWWRGYEHDLGPVERFLKAAD